MRFSIIAFSLVILYGCTNADSSTLPVAQQHLSEKDSIALLKKVLHSISKVDSIKPIIKDGDMVLRTGNDFTSYSFRQLCKKDKTYSHCGIAFKENDTFYVYHAIGGEFNPDQKLKREILEDFCSAEINKGFGIFRFTTLQQQHIINLQKMVQEHFYNGLPFDMAFDLTTDDRMYCAEFTAKMYSRCLEKKQIFDSTTIGAKTFIAIDNLMLHPNCKQITKTVYNFPQ